MEFSFLKSAGLQFVVLLEANLHVKTSRVRRLEDGLLSLLLKGGEAAAFCAGESLGFSDVARLPVGLLEVHEGTAEAWLCAKSCWCDQFCIDIWLEALSNLLNCILHLILFHSVQRVHFLCWVQVRIVVVILGNVHEPIRHAWAEDLLELSECQVTLVACINQFHH